MSALVSIGLGFLCSYPPLPGIESPFAVALPLASSIFKDLPKCSVPLSSKALFKADLLLNLTNAIPFDFPSGLISKLTLRIYPHGASNSLMSES